MALGRSLIALAHLEDDDVPGVLGGSDALEVLGGDLSERKSTSFGR